jgi:SAM-dependent methyltransferase
MTPLQTAPAVSCDHPSASQEVLFPARDYITGDAFQVLRCRDCGLAHTDPLPPAEQMRNYYPTSYYGTERRFIKAIDWLLDRVNARKARRLAGAAGSEPGSVLEVGCGHGLVLDQLRRLGWNVTGTEITEESSLYARQVLGLDVRIGDLRGLALPDDSYDLVIVWHVLEHLPDPEGQLREIGRILRPGGLLVVGVPNFGSTEALWARDKWFHLDVPRHLSHFSPKSLRHMFAAAGLESARVDFFSPEHDFFSFIQSVLNKLGVKQNLLYHLVRRGGAKVLHEGKQEPTGASLAATAVLAPVLGVASLAWVPFAALTRRGSAMIAYARKPRA